MPSATMYGWYLVVSFVINPLSFISVQLEQGDLYCYFMTKKSSININKFMPC